MAVDFEDLLDKAGNELNDANQIMLKSYTDAKGATKTYRDLSELAQLQTFARNQTALNDRDTNGIIQRVERDYDDGF